MTFAQPRMLWLMAVAVPLLILFLWWAWRKKQQLTAQFVQSRLLAHLTVGVSRPVQQIRLALLVLAVALLLVALARPQMGFVWEEAHQRGLDLIIAIDTSRSMLAEDLRPNRLERAKLAALDLLELARQDRLGLVAFAGSAFLQCPLTLDEGAFQQSLAVLDVGIIPQGGTALAQAIQTAMEALEGEGDNHKAIILFSDGEDHDEGAVEAAQTAARAGIRIFTVGVGTPGGELLRVRDENGDVSYIKDADGNVVKSRLNEALLTEVATAAQGFYTPLAGPNPMKVLYDRGLAPLPRAEISSKWTRQYKEQYHWPLGLALLLLVIELFLPERKQVRRTEAAAEASTNAALRKAVAPLVLLLCSLSIAASPRAAFKKYSDGDFAAARKDYERLLQEEPEDPRLHYNAGTAAYQAQDFQEAARHFSAALTASDLNLQQRSFYNLGNAWFRIGESQAEPDKTIAAWEQSIKQYEASLKLDPKDADAAYNLELVKRKLEELKKQRQEQQKQNQQDQSQEKKEQEEQEEQKNNQDQQKQQQENQDQQNQDSSGSEQKPDSQPEKKPDSPEQKPGEQPEPEQDGSQEKPGDSQDGQAPSPQENPEGSQSNPTGEPPPERMTPEQVRRLLDAQKNDQKALIFAPKQTNRARIFKDW